MMRIRLALALILLAGGAKADVSQPRPDLTEVSFQFHAAASAAQAYAAVIHPEKWWSSKHTYSGDAINLSLDPTAGGCWCEKLPKGGSVQHMRVLAAIPGALLRLAGELGPLQEQPLAGVMSWSFKADPAGGSTVRVQYRIGGPADLSGDWPKAVNAVLGEQIQTLQHLLESRAP